VDGQIDPVAKPAKGFIDRIIYNFMDQVVQTPLADIANVHRRPLAHSLQTFENLYIVSCVFLCL
jgi:hypothetical protein